MLKSMVIVLFGHILEPKQAAALQNLLSAAGHYLDIVDETSPAQRRFTQI